MALLIALTALVAIASLSVATRLYPESRSERLLAALVVFSAVLQLVMQLLGWTGTLRAGTLATASVVVSLLLLAGSLAPDFEARAATLGTSVVETLRLPADAFRLLAAARQPIVALGLFVAIGVVVWTTFLAYLAPSSSWDGLWYHEPLAYFAIQSGSFLMPEHLPVHLACIEGYPRGAENFITWIAIFSGRDLVDAVGLLSFPMAMLGVFVLTRQSASVPTAIGAASAVMLVPASVLQLRSTYVDLTVLAAFVAAAHFSTRPDFKSRDVWMASLAIGFSASTKANQIVFGGILALFAIGRLVEAARRERSARIALHALGGFVVSLAMFAPGYVRNYFLHDNPIWPLRVHSETLGIELEGPLNLQTGQPPLPRLLHELFGLPSQGQDYFDTRMHAYGYGMTYLVLPLVVAALFVILGRLPRTYLRGDRDERKTLSRLLFFLVVGVLVFAASPEVHWGRYALGGVVLATVVVAWLLDRRWAGLSAEGLLSAVIFANLLTLAWAEPAWEVPATTALDLLELQPRERVNAETGVLLFRTEMRRLREERIGPGDVVAFDDDLAFPASLWNDAISNRVVHVPFRGRDEYLEALDAAGAEWALMYEFRDEYRALEAHPERWRELGVAQFEIRIFERVTPVAAAP